MDKLDINKICKREDTEKLFISYLKNQNKTSNGIYLYGDPGVGKTYFVKSILKKYDYDIVYYNASDIRTASMLANINNSNMATNNVLNSFYKKKRPIVIVMDEIDNMNLNDKGGLGSLIKLIRFKKTKKQKLEESTNNMVICIGNNDPEKKLSDLIKICEIVNLSKPKDNEICQICQLLLPNIDEETINYIITYINNDFRKLVFIYDLYRKQKDPEKFLSFLSSQLNYISNPKYIVKNLYNIPCSIKNHKFVINDTDRTIVALIWHENIIDILDKLPSEQKYNIYKNMLENTCFGDYIDRITFKKQIWHFSEQSSIIKTLNNNYILHNSPELKSILEKEKEKKNKVIRFTKILTKYSTEYNNSIFIQELCKKLYMDKKDMFMFFKYLDNSEEHEKKLLENHDITRLDINRIQKLITAFT